MLVNQPKDAKPALLPPGPNGRSPFGQDAPEQRSNALGSGFVVSAEGLIVTNNHVIGDANEITVVFSDGLRLKAEVVGKDTKVELTTKLTKAADGCTVNVTRGTK